MPPDGVTLCGSKFYTVSQFAKHLGISRWSIHDQMNLGQISYTLHPGFRNGRRLIPESEVRRILEGR